MQFQYLLGDISASHFVESHWDCSPMHIDRNDPLYYDAILSNKAIKKYLSQEDIRFPFIKLYSEYGEADQSSYAVLINAEHFKGECFVDAYKLAKALNERTAVVIDDVALLFPSAASWIAGLENDLTARVKPTVFFGYLSALCVNTQKNSNCFLMQIGGTCDWRLTPPGNDASCAVSFKVSPGDLVFIPRDWLAVVSSTEQVVCLQLAILAPNWLTLISKILDDVQQGLHFRQTASILPVDSDSLFMNMKNEIKLKTNYKKQSDALRLPANNLSANHQMGRLKKYISRGVSK